MLAQMQLCYPCTARTVTVLCLSLSPKWLQDILELYNPDITIDNYADILTHCDSFNISVSDAQVEFVMAQTKAQSKSKLWFTLRAGRVTASAFHAACHTRIEKPATSLLRAICSPNDQCFSSVATDWGKSNEAIARDAYVTSQHAQHSDFDCSNCGLRTSEIKLASLWEARGKES